MMGILFHRTLLCLARGALFGFLANVWVSESKHMEPSHLLRWGHPVIVGTAQCDRCYCRPARQGNKTIPLICRFIPPSTGLQSQSMHNMFIMYRHLQKRLVGWKNIPHVKTQKTTFQLLTGCHSERWYFSFLFDIMLKHIGSQVYGLFWVIFHCVHIGYPTLHELLSEIFLTWKI